MDADGLGPHHHGTMHIGPTLDYLERAYDDAKYGRPSDEPILELTLPTSVDRTIAPPGKHILSMFVQYAPYRLAEGDWDEPARTVRRSLHRDAGAVRTQRARGDLAPPGAHAARPGADVRPDRRQHFSRRHEPGQLFSLRPVAGWADHRTPVRACICAARQVTPAAA